MSAAGFDESLLDLLLCPITRTPLRYDPDAEELVSEAAGVAFPIREGVPVLIIEAARPL